MTVKKSKKNSTSSIFLHRNYAMHECALESERMTKILVSHYNLIISNQFYPEKNLKNFSILLEKGKGLMLGNLRKIQLSEADFSTSNESVC